MIDSTANAAAARDAHMETQIAVPQRPTRYNIGDILAVGLGTTIAMWALGYAGRMPGDKIPSPVIMVLMVLSLLIGGFVAGSRMRRGVWGGLYSGFVTGTTNLLLLFTLGKHLTSDQRIIAYAVVWAPAFVLGCGVLEFIGAFIGSRFPKRGRAMDGEAALTKVTVAATVLLIFAGGMVVGMNAGLAVPDWPNSFHWNMWMFPLSHMTGGVFFEHSHRLMGSLVGLASGALAIYLTFADRRRWVKVLGWVAFIMVCLQGLLGGLRVTGHLTLSQKRSHMDPSETIAIIHGVFAQIYLATAVALCAFCSKAWRAGRRPSTKPWAKNDRILTTVLVLLLVVQLVLGALLRHLGAAMVEHIVMAGIILLVVMIVGTRTWGLNADQPILRYLGTALLVDVVLQIVLGISALMILHGPKPPVHPTLLEAFVTTIHQVNGAALFCLAVLAAIWTRRLLVEGPESQSRAALAAAGTTDSVGATV